MTTRHARLGGPCLLLLAALAGCQRAERFDPPARAPAQAKEAAPAPKAESPTPNVDWLLGSGGDADDVPIEFVSQTSRPKEWQRLPDFWNEPAVARAALVGLPGLPGAPLALATRDAVKIKVPLGLLDPSAVNPSARNITRRQWELGRRLFFDETWLTGKKGTACATCHAPDRGYTDDKAVATPGGFNTPTLLNVVYATHLFWDGRARRLEEVVQRTPEDEREAPPGAPFRHVWGGAVGRLRASKGWEAAFRSAMGTVPTQDAVGRALAAYLSTLLAGDSVYDRADRRRRELGKDEPPAKHYRAVLTKDDLGDLGRRGADLGAVADELASGEKLFRGTAACAGCHTPANGYFSDNDFHNIGTGQKLDRALAHKLVRQGVKLTGRFAVAPLGEKGQYLVGAYRTPTLRGLLRTGPYFHTGETDDLTAVVRRHVAPTGPEENVALAPRLATPDLTHRDFKLRPAEIEALVLFLKALNGQDADPFVKARPPASK
jgi:cytochrome c peroxidase